MNSLKRVKTDNLKYCKKQNSISFIPFTSWLIEYDSYCMSHTFTHSCIPIILHFSSRYAKLTNLLNSSVFTRFYVDIYGFCHILLHLNFKFRTSLPVIRFIISCWRHNCYVITNLRSKMYRFMILFSRQGKVRLQKWFHAIADKDRKKICRDIVNIVSSKLYSNN